jgi:hypothetical protein
VILGYFTAGVLMVLGLLLIVKFGRVWKPLFAAGGILIILGGWWAANEFWPEHPFIDGWLGWAVKIAAAVVLVGLGILFMIERKREVAKFRAEMDAEAAKKQEQMYKRYDDYKYDADTDGVRVKRVDSDDDSDDGDDD